MNTPIPDTALQMRSLVRKSGELQLSLESVPVPQLQDDEVLVRVEATPLNPSDLALLFGLADMSTAKTSGSPSRPVVTAEVPAKMMRALTARLDQSMSVGNEGAGLVVKAGGSPAAQALLGKTVALLGGGMYAQYRAIKAGQCLVLPPGTTAAEGASCFVNPLTSLSMTEVMRREGHKALVHTAAASNLGQMLNRICMKDGIALVNIVRKPEQEELLKKMGAKYVLNSAAPAFMDTLTKALIETGATLCFDAIGGGTLAGQVLTCMEAAANTHAQAYSPYGSAVHKQVYIYGGLDRGPTELSRNFGMQWGMGGWLLTSFLKNIGFEAAQKLRERVAAELKTTFASHYTREVSLAEALSLEAIDVYGKQATAEKYLITPQKGL